MRFSAVVAAILTALRNIAIFQTPTWLRQEKNQQTQTFWAGRRPGQAGPRPWDKRDPIPGTNWDPSLGQTDRFLCTSTVKLPFCPVCPWDRWGFVPGTIVPQGPSEKYLCVFCLLVFSAPNWQDAIPLRSKIASERRLSLRLKRAK